MHWQLVLLSQLAASCRMIFCCFSIGSCCFRRALAVHSNAWCSKVLSRAQLKMLDQGGRQAATQDACEPARGCTRYSALSLCSRGSCMRRAVSSVATASARTASEREASSLIPYRPQARHIARSSSKLAYSATSKGLSGLTKHLLQIALSTAALSYCALGQSWK